MGRNAEASGSASLKHIAAVYSYSKTKGLFAGVSLEGSVIATRNDANEKLYGQRVTAKELLNGTIAPPPEADMLYRALNARFHTLGNTGAMYARNSAEGSPRAYNFKSSNISAPGTIRQPPPLRNPPSAPPPTSSYNNQPPPPYTAPPPSNNNNNNYYGQEKSHYQQPPQPTSYGAPPSVATSRAPPPPPPAPIRKPQQPTARALYDFNGEQDGDLSFREGDVITIVEKSDSQDDWWTGSVGGRQGIVSIHTLYYMWMICSPFCSSSLPIMCNYNRSVAVATLFFFIFYILYLLTNTIHNFLFLIIHVHTHSL